VAKDILGVSGRRIIQAILDGYDHPKDLAERVALGVFEKVFSVGNPIPVMKEGRYRPR
jgi:hypothetical protein